MPKVGACRKMANGPSLLNRPRGPVLIASTIACCCGVRLSIGSAGSRWASCFAGRLTDARADFLAMQSFQLLFANEIDEGRHADMGSAFDDGAVMLANVEFGEIAERVLQELAREHQFDFGRPAGPVVKLRGAIAFHQ